MEIYCKNTLSGLTPLYHNDFDEKKKLKIGEVYKVKVSQPRNLKFHKKFFALIKLVFDNQDQFDNMETLRIQLLISAGHYYGYFDLNGMYRKEPKSISFGSMTAEEFEEVYTKVIDSVHHNFGFDQTNLKEEIERYF